MRLFLIFVLALAAEVAVASSWFSRAGVFLFLSFFCYPFPRLMSSKITANNSQAYNKWHETELERWLSDHDIPYPKSADRKDLKNIVKENWQSKISSPYVDWDSAKLQKYLKERGHETREGAEESKESLTNWVKKYWYETEEQAEDAWGRVPDWIFDSCVPLHHSLFR